MSVDLSLFNKAMLSQNFVEQQKQKYSSQILKQVEMLEDSAPGKSLSRELSNIFYQKMLNRLTKVTSKVTSMVDFRSFIESSRSNSCLTPCVTDQATLEHPIIAKAFGVKYPSVPFQAADMELFFSICDVATTEKVGIFLLGSQPTVLRKVKSKLEHDFPEIQIVGATPLAFYPNSDQEIKSLVQKINSSEAGIVFVSLGCRHQARWMTQQRSTVQGVMIGLGSVFPQYIGLGKKSLHAIHCIERK